MSVTRLARASTHDRLAALEKRADGHDLVIAPMAGQVNEMYDLLKKWRNINWFVVKLCAVGGGALGFIAIMLTIASTARHLLTGH